MKSRANRRVMERKIVQGLQAGKSSNELSREHRVCKKTVKRIREQAESYGYLSGGRELPGYPASVFEESGDGRGKSRRGNTDELLKSHREWIRERLEAGWKAITVYEELPVRLSRASFYRYLDRHELRKGKRPGRVISEICTAPGESLQLDWGKLRDAPQEKGGKLRPVWVLTGVLGFSRYRLARLVWSNSIEETLRALSSMFEELGGVPQRVTTDNPKCFATKADRYEPLLNPVAERFSDHYDFLLECLPPRTPQQKGKVERQIPFMRRLYEAHGDDWWGIEESERYLRRKVGLANESKHGTTKLKPAEEFQHTEQPALSRLPPTPYEVEQYHVGRVRKDGHVRFDGKYYSVALEHIAQDVTIIGNSTQVSIYHQGELLEVHQRVTDPYRSKSTKDHHKPPWERSLQDDSYYRKRAREAGEWVEQLIVTLLSMGNGFIDTRKVWGILSLTKSFPARYVNEACRLAYEQERWGYHVVRRYAETLYAAELAESPEQELPLKRAAPKYTHSISSYSEKVKLTLVTGGKQHET